MDIRSSATSCAGSRRARPGRDAPADRPMVCGEPSVVQRVRSGAYRQYYSSSTAAWGDGSNGSFGRRGSSPSSGGVSSLTEPAAQSGVAQAGQKDAPRCASGTTALAGSERLAPGAPVGTYARCGAQPQRRRTLCGRSGQIGPVGRATTPAASASSTAMMRRCTGLTTRTADGRCSAGRAKRLASDWRGWAP